MPSNIFLEIVILVFAAFLGGFIARSFSLTPILGYIASGIIFSFFGKSILGLSSFFYLSQIGISLLLFTLGFEISLERIKNLNRNVIVLGFLHAVVTSVILFPVIFLFHFDIKIAVLFSVLFSFSSTAIVVKILEEKGLLNDFPGNNVFIFLLIEDILVIPAIFILPILFSTSPLSFSFIFSFLFSFVKTAVAFVGIFLVSKFILPRMMNILFRYPSSELNMLGTIFIAVSAIGLFSLIGLPQGIAAFLAGVLISEEGKNLAPLSEIRPLRDIFLVLFFVLSGMMLDVNFVVSHFIKIVLFTGTILFVKFFTIFFLLRSYRYIYSSSVFMASFLANIGEFAVVIGQFLFFSSVINNETYNTLLSVFILSLILTPFWINFFKDRAIYIFKFLPVFGKDELIGNKIKYYHGVEGLENHVVICGHGRVGKQIRTLLDVAGVPYIVIDFNRKIIQDLLEQGKYAIYADPTDENVLKSAFIDKTKVLVLALPDTISQKKIIKSALSLNPKLTIITRTHKEEERYDLLNLGVNSIVIPEFEAGLKIGAKVLEIFGVNNDSILYFTKNLRKENLL